MPENKAKQWWESGYDRGADFLNQPRAQFTDKKPKLPGEEQTFGLWKPDTFYVPKPTGTDDKGREIRQSKKATIFLDDGPIYVRQHIGQVAAPYMPSGVTWDKFTCGLGVYAPVVYEIFKGFKGIDDIPGNFLPCCGQHFAGKSKKGNPLPGNPQDYAYYTVLDCNAYEDKKGVTHQFVLRLFPAQGDTIDKMMRYREENGTLAGCLYTAIRYKGGKSSNVGEDFKFEKRGDLAKIFPLAMYSGRKFSDLLEEARTNPDFRKAFAKIFAIPTEGDIPDMLYPFNYQEVLRPKSLEELESLFGKVPVSAPSSATKKASGSIPGFGGSDETGPAGVDDDIPF